MTYPAVSIVIPCKARLSHLCQALPFFAAQTFTDWELIVVDYACPEQTARWVTRYAVASGDPRIRAVVAPVEPLAWNLAAARNFGFRQTAGDVIWFADADNRPRVDWLANHVEAAGQNRFLFRCTDNAGTMLMHRNTFLRLCGWNETASMNGWGAEDGEFSIRATRAGFEIRPGAPVNPIPHTEAERNRFAGGKPVGETTEANWQAVREQPFRGLPEWVR